MTTVLAITAYATALTVSFLLVRWLARIALWAQTFEGAPREGSSPGGCRICVLFGRIPFGPPYWLLRAHLRRIGRLADTGEREVIR